MPKTPRNRRGRDRHVRLVPAGHVALGDKVWWQRTHYYHGSPTTYMWSGIVEVKRKKVCVVRDPYNHDHVVGVGMLFKPET